MFLDNLNVMVSVLRLELPEHFLLPVGLSGRKLYRQLDDCIAEPWGGEGHEH